MNLLADNNFPVPAIAAIVGHTVVHVRDKGWKDLKNGELLQRADKQFNGLITIDKNMPFQSSLRGLRLVVAVLDCRSNRIEDVRPLIPNLLRALPSMLPGTFNIVTL